MRFGLLTYCVGDSQVVKLRLETLLLTETQRAKITTAQNTKHHIKPGEKGNGKAEKQTRWAEGSCSEPSVSEYYLNARSEVATLEFASVECCEQQVLRVRAVLAYERSSSLIYLIKKNKVFWNNATELLKTTTVRGGFQKNPSPLCLVCRKQHLFLFLASSSFSSFRFSPTFFLTSSIEQQPVNVVNQSRPSCNLSNGGRFADARAPSLPPSEVVTSTLRCKFCMKL